MSDVKIGLEEEPKMELSLESKEIEIETKTSKLNVFNWSMFDLANTIYSMVIVSLIINKYVITIGQLENGWEYGDAVRYVSIIVTIMQVIIAIGMPIMGALSDVAGKRKPYVITLTGIILLGASLLGFLQNIYYVLVFYIIANIAYQWSLAFYDAMLPFIAAPKDAGKVGGFGVAFGYLGTLIVLPIMLVLENQFGSPVSQITAENPVLAYGYFGEWPTYIISMGLFLVFAIPFLFVKERQNVGIIGDSFRQVGRTFKEIRQHREMFKFIIGYFLVVDVANVIVANMLLLVTDGLLMESSFGIYFIMISTVSAVIFTFFIGLFADKFGAKKSFYLVGSLWAVAITIGVLAIFIWADAANPINASRIGPFIAVIIMGVISGPALGGTWVAQRQMVIELAPKEKFGEYFGFSKLSGKVSSVIGTLIWGFVFYLYDLMNYKTYAIEMIVMGVIMAIGILIISFVKPQKRLLQETPAIET